MPIRPLTKKQKLDILTESQYFRVPKKYYLLLKEYLIKNNLKLSDYIKSKVEELEKTDKIPIYEDLYKQEKGFTGTKTTITKYHYERLRFNLKKRKISLSKWLTYNIISTLENEHILKNNTLTEDEEEDNVLSTFNCKLPINYYKKLKLYCFQNDLTLEELLEKLIVNYLDNPKPIRVIANDETSFKSLSIKVKNNLKQEFKLLLIRDNILMRDWLVSQLEQL